SRVAGLALAMETRSKDETRPPVDALARDIVEAVHATIGAMKAHLAPVAGAASAAAPDAPKRIETPTQAIERELARALEREELAVLYQPIVDRHGVQTRGAEALLRWTKDSGEVIPPSVFIPVAEKSGLIHDLGEWVLRRACADAAAWPDIDISIN